MRITNEPNQITFKSGYPTFGQGHLSFKGFYRPNVVPEKKDLFKMLPVANGVPPIYHNAQKLDYFA